MSQEGTAASSSAARADTVSETCVRAAIDELLPGVNLEETSLGEFRSALSLHVGHDLETQADKVNEWIRDSVQKPAAPTPRPHLEGIIQSLGEEPAGPFKHPVHLVTISRVLPGTLEATDLRDISGMSRKDIALCVQLSFDDPVATRGRPRTQAVGGVVQKMVVFQEAHADGDKHFHVAVQLQKSRSFAPAKTTLRTRDHLAAHFSSKHTQFWSAVRYGYMPTLAKPVVDASPLSWCRDSGFDSLDLFAESQRPWNAILWKRRREEVEKVAQQGDGAKKAKFNKLDLTALILSQELTTPASVLAYTQNHGTEAMQLFVHQRQKYLKDYVAEALEWGQATKQAEEEKQTEWSFVCATAAGACPQGTTCTYAHAAQGFFDANAETLSRTGLAAALRNILISGPSKTTRAPMIVGPTNSGKSTLVLPFDTLFGFGRVFHKPALGSSFALRNILKEKRFLFWDDFRPVEYGQRTVPVTTFLSLFQGQPFEVQVSQSFNDGNVDFEWHHGCVLTAKSEGLWAPAGCVDDEDIRHMKSRVLLFHCMATVQSMKDTMPCARCMCSWIVDGAREFDAAQALRVPQLPLAGAERQQVPGKLEGMADMMAHAKLPQPKAEALAAEILALGALDINELTVSDWKNLAAFHNLLPFEQRRLLSFLLPG